MNDESQSIENFIAGPLLTEPTLLEFVAHEYAKEYGAKLVDANVDRVRMEKRTEWAYDESFSMTYWRDEMYEHDKGYIPEKEKLSIRIMDKQIDIEFSAKKKQIELMLEEEGNVTIWNTYRFQEAIPNNSKYPMQCAINEAFDLLDQPNFGEITINTYFRERPTYEQMKLNKMKIITDLS